MATAATGDRAASPPPATVDEGHANRWRILAVLAAVAFMAQLDLFIVNITVPAIGRSFGGSLSGLSWVLNAYAIVFAALLVQAGRLADHFGRRRFLLVGVTIFTLASAACAAAPSLPFLVAARAVQAVGAALIVPTSLGLLYPSFPKRQHATVVGIWAGVAAVAGSSGPPIGGLVSEVNWRWIFLINVPIGVATLIAGWRLLPEVRAQKGARLPDGVSAVAAAGRGEPARPGHRGGARVGLEQRPDRGAAGRRGGRYGSHRGPDDPAPARPDREGPVHQPPVHVRDGRAVLVLRGLRHLPAQRHAVPAGRVALQRGAGWAGASCPGRSWRRFSRSTPGGWPAGSAGSGPRWSGRPAWPSSAIIWLTLTTSQPAYLTAILPGMIVAGISAGLTQAPLFAAAGTLPPDRATTGSAVLDIVHARSAARSGWRWWSSCWGPGLTRWPVTTTPGRPKPWLGRSRRSRPLVQACVRGAQTAASPAYRRKRQLDPGDAGKAMRHVREVHRPGASGDRPGSGGVPRAALHLRRPQTAQPCWR